MDTQVNFLRTVIIYNQACVSQVCVSEVQRKLTGWLQSVSYTPGFNVINDAKNYMQP